MRLTARRLCSSILGVWLLVNGFQFGVGMLDGEMGVKGEGIKRIEVLFPGYRLGRWAMEDLNRAN